MANNQQMSQKVQRVQLTGGISSLEFSDWSGQYLVKNFSGGDIYISFEPTVSENNSIRILNGFAQLCVINERDGMAGQAKANKVYIKGTGEVEVQQLWF